MLLWDRARKINRGCSFERDLVTLATMMMFAALGVGHVQHILRPQLPVGVLIQPLHASGQLRSTDCAKVSRRQIQRLKDLPLIVCSSRPSEDRGRVHRDPRRAGHERGHPGGEQHRGEAAARGEQPALRELPAQKVNRQRKRGTR